MVCSVSAPALIILWAFCIWKADCWHRQTGVVDSDPQLQLQITSCCLTYLHEDRLRTKISSRSLLQVLQFLLVLAKTLWVGTAAIPKCLYFDHLWVCFDAHSRIVLLSCLFLRRQGRLEGVYLPSKPFLSVPKQSL